MIAVMAQASLVAAQTDGSDAGADQMSHRRISLAHRYSADEQFYF